MKEYAEKSLEELRLEDYSSNRKGPQTGLFTSNQNVSGMFGTQTPAASSLFGQTSVQSTGLFGPSTNNTNSLVNNPSSAFVSNPSTFGSSSSGGLFGKPISSNPVQNSFGFGNTQQTFGAKPFGQSSTTTSGLFNSQPIAGGFGSQSGTASNFGQPTAPSLFGNTNNNVASTGVSSFGIGNTSANQTGFMFGNNNNNTNLNPFGAPKPAFSTNAFNTTQSTPSNAFSGFGTATSTGGNLFSGSKPFGGLMQTTAPNALSFGQNTGAVAFGSQPTSGNLFGPPANTGSGVGIFSASSNPFGTSNVNTSYGSSLPSLLNK